LKQLKQGEPKMSSYSEKLEELQRLREQVRILERQAEREARAMRPLTVADEQEMRGYQARADEAYSGANRRAPPPLPMERPDEYRRRLADGVKAYSPRWSKVDFATIEETALPIVESQVYQDAVANGRTHGLKPTEIRERVTVSGGGHRVIEFDGGPDAHFVQQFARAPRIGILKSQAEYAQMSRDAQMARITEIVRYGQRPTVQAPRAGF
jgi:hypothetical protein